MGAYISYCVNDGIPCYLYEVPLDYKPGIIEINGIKISETVFDYLENKKILSVFIKYQDQSVE